MKTAHDQLIEVLMASGMNVHEANRKARIIEKREAAAKPAKETVEEPTEDPEKDE